MRLLEALAASQKSMPDTLVYPTAMLANGDKVTSVALSGKVFLVITEAGSPEMPHTSIDTVPGKDSDQWQPFIWAKRDPTQDDEDDYLADIAGMVAEQGEIQSINDYASGGNDILIRKAGAFLTVYFHPGGSEELIVTRLGNFEEETGMSLAAVEFSPATKTGIKVIEYWLAETGQSWDREAIDDDALPDDEVNPDYAIYLEELDKGQWFEDEEGFLYINPADERQNPSYGPCDMYGPDNETMAALLVFARTSPDGQVSDEDAASIGLTPIPHILRRFTPEDGYYHA